MIELFADGPPWYRQRLLSPSVYLDHWAVRRFSENTEERGRLTSALLHKDGTLVVSWANIVEFLAMDANSAAAAKAEELFNAAWPHLYFLRSEPFEVVSRENLRATGTLADDPAEDKDVLNIVVSQQASSGLYLPTMNGIVSTVLSAKDRLEPSAVSLKNTVRDVARERLSRADTDRAEKAKIDNAPTQPRRTRATLSLIEVLLRVLFRTAPKTMEPNDTFDLLHAAVPIAYCDFVLLDRTWCAVAVQAIREMREAGVTAPLANVYSGKKGEVERFLAALEAYPPKQSMLTSEKTSEKGIS